MSDSMSKTSKRRKGSGDMGALLVETGMRPLSVDVEQSNRFEQLSIDANKGPVSNTSSASGDSKDRNLFLSLSTSPINHQDEIDQTPISKNTIKREAAAETNASSIFKNKTKSSQPKLESITSKDGARPSETPTPPVHGEMGDSGMMTDEHSMLHRHLRGQSFTPLPHPFSDSGTNSPSNNTMAAAIINPQLSWSIAGDTPSLGDLADWEDEKRATDTKNRPSSTCSSEARNMVISPHDFPLWKEENEDFVSGTTTPLPVFFSSNEGSENNMHFEHGRKPNHGEQEHPHPMFMPSSGRSGLKASNHKYPPPSWSKNDMPVDKMAGGMPHTPMYPGNEYRDDGFAVRSPDGDRRQDIDYYQPFMHPVHHGHPQDRVRNLRGRVPPTHHMPPMPLHIHPGMSTHLPMTSPMGLGPGKAGLWSPHGGMHPPMASPHHMGSPLSNMAQSKRKCVPLKPPIPSKFQGDFEKAKGAQVPEFTSLVNFPAHISQKQAVNLPEGMRCCVMCGQACPCSVGGKLKKGGKKSDKGGEGLAPRGSNGQDMMGDKNGGYAIIPTQNKGLCTLCDVNVWIVVQSGLEIKWCKGCKNFRPWASFGDKGLATKCLRCRERQREKYALQKEEKEKSRTLKAKKEKS